MIYDFASKIRNVTNKDELNAETLTAIAEKINDEFNTNLDVKFILSDGDNTGDLLVKSQASVSSMVALHDRELETAITAFKAYLEQLAEVINGEISTNEAFYNNSKMFKKLYV